MAIHDDHWNKILDEAEVDDVLLQGSGERLQRVWAKLTPVLNKLRNNSVNKTNEGWKQAFKFWKNSVKKKVSSAANNQLQTHEVRYVSLCHKAGIPVGINKKASTKRASSVTEVEPQVDEVPTGRTTRKRKPDSESDTTSNVSSNVTLAQYDIFLNYAKSHPDILEEDTDVKIEEWKCLASLLECIAGQKNKKMVKRDYMGWKSYFEQWIREVITTEEEELGPRGKEFREIWNGVLTKRFDAEIDRLRQHLNMQKTVEELKKFNDTLQETPNPNKMSFLKIHLL